MTDLGIDRAWDMSDSESKSWDRTFGKAVSMAKAEGIRSNAVIERMLKRIDGEIARCVVDLLVISLLIPCPRLISFPKAMVTLLSHVVVSDVDPLPIGQVIDAIPLYMLTELLTTLGESLQLWIGDKEEVMLQSEFNSIVRFHIFRPKSKMSKPPRR
jgi:hypothetical protein